MEICIINSVPFSAAFCKASSILASSFCLLSCKYFSSFSASYLTPVSQIGRALSLNLKLYKCISSNVHYIQHHAVKHLGWEKSFSLNSSFIAEHCSQLPKLLFLHNYALFHRRIFLWKFRLLRVVCAIYDRFLSSSIHIFHALGTCKFLIIPEVLISEKTQKFFDPLPSLYEQY